MKLATLVSFLRPAVVMLLPLILIGWVEQAAAHPVQQKLSPPLQNPEMYRTVTEVARHAYSMNPENDLTHFLMPRIRTDQDYMTICCLHANYLEFYLNENVTRDHPLVAEFRGKVQAMGDEGITKAMGEIDIMFTFLQGYCVAPAAATSST